MMAIAHQVAGVLGAEYKQRVKIGIVERILGALQTFLPHSLRIESRFPINRNHSNVRHGVFLLKNKCTFPLASFIEACQIRGFAFGFEDLAPIRAGGHSEQT
jgi:hypothetical protein